jgi:hypothetical protein
MSEQVFVMGLIIAGTTLVLTVKMIAGAFSGRHARADLNQLKDELDHQAAALEEAQGNIAQQASQLAELQERLDFTERVLAQQRERASLKPGDPS